MMTSVYIVQLHAQTPKHGDPKVTIRVPENQALDRADAMKIAEELADKQSLYDMGWLATSCVGPKLEDRSIKPKKPTRKI